jgi:Protein of unknown function (DUF3467)
MSEQPAEGRESNFQVQVPPELEGGVYANFLSVWHTGHEFTLDFSATQPPQRLDPDEPSSPVNVPCRVVARVKIPPTLVFDVIRAMNENMTRYESVFGEIRRPDERDR